MTQDWTPAQDLALRLKRASGMSASQIGKDLGKTRNAVIGRWHRLQGTYDGYYAACSAAAKKATEATRIVQERKEAEAIQQLRRDIAAKVAPQTAIRKARNAGARWIAIGQAFGVSKQRVAYVGTCAREGTHIRAQRTGP